MAYDALSALGAVALLEECLVGLQCLTGGAAGLFALPLDEDEGAACARAEVAALQQFARHRKAALVVLRLVGRGGELDAVADLLWSLKAFQSVELGPGGGAGGELALALLEPCQCLEGGDAEVKGASGLGELGVEGRGLGAALRLLVVARASSSSALPASRLLG